jgi:hypothetical protein
MGMIRVVQMSSGGRGREVMVASFHKTTNVPFGRSSTRWPVLNHATPSSLPVRLASSQLADFADPSTGLAKLGPVT